MKLNVRRMAARAALAALVLGIPVALSTSGAVAARQDHIKHVLLISVDGLHQNDLEWYVANHPGTALARLTRGGVEFSNAHTSDPSDSDPGGTALMTGGDPRATGVYYDVEYSHAVYKAGTTTCTGTTGADVIYDSPDDIDSTRLDAGEHIPGIDQNPALIMNMTATPQSLLVQATFPVDPTTCQPIPPHAYLKVNTIYEVARSEERRVGKECR